LRILKDYARLELTERKRVSPITIRLRILKDPRALAWLEGRGLSFTHHDPLEDTESERFQARGHCALPGFTHHDPLEDTEREMPSINLGTTQIVSPITIRLRILKACRIVLSSLLAPKRFHPSRSA